MHKLIAASLVVFLSAGFGSTGHARVWFIYSDGTGQAPSIQAGIDSCAAGDTVVAMPGVFTGDGNWGIDFRGKSIAVIGGRSFDPAITDTTIIDGLYPQISHYSAFHFRSNEDSTSVLSGLVIRRFYHSAIWCENSSPTIKNNDISGHLECIRCDNSSARIIENVLRNLRNKLDCYGGSPCIERNICIGGNDCVSSDMCPEWQLSECTSLRISGNTVEGIVFYNCSGLVDSNSINGYFLTIPTFGVFGCTLAITNNRIGYSDGAALYCEASKVLIANNQINSYLVMRASLPSHVIGNDIGWGEWHHIGGIQYDGDSTTVIEGNVIHEFYDGPGIECYSPIRIANNVIYSNGAWYGPEGHYSGGIACHASALIEGNTIVGNRQGGVYCAPVFSPILRNNIITGNTIAGGIRSDSPSIIVECCDVYNNEGGNYVGIPDQAGLNGNLSLDPIFCDAASRDYSIHALSPCAPGNHPGGAECGLIGALGVDCDYVATLLQSYRAAVEASTIVVRWELAPGAASDLRFVILRKKSEAGEYEERPDGSGILHSGTTFSYKDTGCEPGVEYRYRVDVVDEDGRRELFETDTVVMPAMPLTLHQNHPNPFNPSTTIEYYLPERAHVRLEIYDASGRRLAILVDGAQDQGAHSADWHGIDNEGRSMASGVYFSRLTAGKQAISRKMVLLR